MKTLKGTIRWRDLGSGFYVLETEDESIQLVDPPTSIANYEDQTVSVQGTLDPCLSFGMTSCKLMNITKIERD